jgi:uncharacterized protein YndB with AHSA1/START domain
MTDAVSRAGTVEHDTFVLERGYPVPPARVFAAWADPAQKVQWFTGSQDVTSTAYQLDFQVGGREFNRADVGTSVFTYDARIEDIVQDQRIVYSYFMTMDGRRISVSLTTVEFRPDGNGTALVLTEHGAYLDGLDQPELRRHGIGEQLAALGTLLGSG